MTHNNEQRQSRPIAARAIRQALRREFGARQYRITRHGDIHVYGPMPNATHIIGWRLYGNIRDRQTLCNLGLNCDVFVVEASTSTGKALA